MKYSKTTLRELSAKYRSILKKCFLLNAMAMGLIVATNASADTPLTKEALLADLNDTEYTDGSFETTLGTQYVSGGDWANEYAQYEFDSNNDGTADAQLAGKTLGDTTIDFTQTAFQFTDQDGNTTDLDTKPTGLTTSDFDKAATVIAAEAGSSAHSGSNLTTTTTVAQNTYSYMADTTGTGTPTLHTLTDDAPVLTDFSKTITLTGSQNNGDVVVTGDSDAGMPQQGAYTFTITKADTTESGTISWVKTGTSYTITSAVEGDLDNDADMTAAIAQAKLEFEAYTNDVTAYNNAKATNAANLATATTNYNTVSSAYSTDVAAQESITTNYSNYTTSYAAADANRTAANSAFSTAFANYSTDVGNYTTAKAAVDDYDTSVSAALDVRTQDQIDVALADGGSIKGAIDNAVAYDNTTSGLTATTMQDAIDENASAIAENTDAITTLNGDANTDGSVAKALADAKAYTDTLENGAVASNTSAIATNTSAIATLNGDEETSGSVAYAVKQLADGAVASNTSAIATNTSAISTLNGDENTSGSVAYAVKQLADGAVASNTSAIATNTSAIATLNGDENTSGSVAYAVKQLADGAVASNTSAIATNTSAIATLNGGADTEGSVAYAVAQEASARDTAIATATTMGATDGKNYTAGSSVIAAIESIDTNMGKIHGLIGSDGSFNGTATSTNIDGTTYKGNLAVGTTVEDHLVALDNTIGIMSNLTTTEKTTVVGAINEVDAKIGTTADGTYVAAANTVGQNLNALDSALGDVRSDMASTQAANNARFAQIDRRIDKLEDKMEKGLAANNALAGLVPLDHTHKTQLSAALGGYGSNQALAVGAFHYINDSTLLNAGVGYGGNSSMSYKVGVTFGF